MTAAYKHETSGPKDDPTAGIQVRGHLVECPSECGCGPSRSCKCAWATSAARRWPSASSSAPPGAGRGAGQGPGLGRYLVGVDIAAGRGMASRAPIGAATRSNESTSIPQPHCCTNMTTSTTASYLESTPSSSDESSGAGPAARPSDPRSVEYAGINYRRLPLVRPTRYRPVDEYVSRCAGRSLG